MTQYLGQVMLVMVIGLVIYLIVTLGTKEILNEITRFRTLRNDRRIKDMSSSLPIVVEAFTDMCKELKSMIEEDDKNDMNRRTIKMDYDIKE